MVDLKPLLRRHAASVESLLESEIPRDSAAFLSEGVWYQFESGGKRIRPALCLISCEAFGGKSQDALPFALATEVLHNFFLVHDDIEDGDTMRRDQPTLWCRVGLANGINVGDYLIAKAYRLILSSPVAAERVVSLLDSFTETFERTVEGQALDINLRGNPDVTLETYYRIVQLKTAFYLALPWVGGAVIAGVEDEVLGPLWELGRCLGPAFQIRDDHLDLTEGKGRGGEIGCDLREGKPSIFYAYILDGSCGAGEERDRLRSILVKPREETTASDIEWAIEFYRRTGALEFAEREAQKLIDRVDRIIDDVPLSEEGRDTFRAIGRYIVERKT